MRVHVVNIYVKKITHVSFFQLTLAIAKKFDTCLIGISKTYIYCDSGKPLGLPSEFPISSQHYPLKLFFAVGLNIALVLYGPKLTDSPVVE